MHGHDPIIQAMSWVLLAIVIIIGIVAVLKFVFKVEIRKLWKDAVYQYRRERLKRMIQGIRDSIAKQYIEGVTREGRPKPSKRRRACNDGLGD